MVVETMRGRFHMDFNTQSHYALIICLWTWQESTQTLFTFCPVLRSREGKQEISDITNLSPIVIFHKTESYFLSHVAACMSMAEMILFYNIFCLYMTIICSIWAWWVEECHNSVAPLASGTVSEVFTVTVMQLSNELQQLYLALLIN